MEMFCNLVLRATQRAQIMFEDNRSSYEEVRDAVYKMLEDEFDEHTCEIVTSRIVQDASRS